ncbi:PREDICTED: uncharacterized protein LOC109476944 [Branchiostoma belcheri]|uniref:Uncharacterized protein LOC109476944 n=1 Tax=Branchiostoma belcheri TaxID=7741 RepID=A0A6P4ZV90_BRABE|nr:PREDICTED: uncharacterized protein LOC109476944 [Branchiostoma belcheri]
MPKHRPTEISLIDNLRLLADDPNVASVRWGEDDRELVLREGRYVVEVLKRRNRLLPVTVFSTLAEKMVQHGLVWTESRLVEGDVEHSFKMEHTEQDTDLRRLATDIVASSSIPDESPVGSVRPPAAFLPARRRVSSTMLVDATDCRRWTGQIPGTDSSPDISDDELTSFLGEARPNSSEEEEMVMQLERNLQDYTSGSSSSDLETLGSPEDVGSSDLPAFAMEKSDVEQQDENRNMARAKTHGETAPGTWLLSPGEVLDSSTAKFEVGNVPVFDGDEKEQELLRKMLAAHRQEDLVVCPPVVCESTAAMSDVITSIVQEEKEMMMMSSPPGISSSLHGDTLEGSDDARLREDLPIIIQEAGFSIPEMSLTNLEEQDLSDPQRTKKRKVESPSFLTQLLTEHQNLYLGHELRQSTSAPTSPPNREETERVSPGQLLEDPHLTTISPKPATPADSTDSFLDLLGYEEDSHARSTAEDGTKRRRAENKGTTVERVDLVEAPPATRAYSPYTDGHQRPHVDRQPAIGYVHATKPKLVEELFVNAAKLWQCEVPSVVTDISDVVAGDAADVSPQFSFFDQLFYEEIETPCPATTTEFVPRSPSIQSPLAVRSKRSSPDDHSSERTTDVPTSALLADIAELVDNLTAADSQPEPDNVRGTERHSPVTIATASELEDVSRCHGNQVCWDFPPDFSTLQAIWMEDWPLDHRAEQTV